MRLNLECSIRAYAVVNIQSRWSDDVMRSVSLNHLPQDNKNHTLFIHTTISREGGGYYMSRVQVYSSYTQRASPTVQSFHLSTSSILLILTTQVIQKLESINLNILDPPTKPTINGHIINHFHQINQTSPYLTMLKVPPITDHTHRQNLTRKLTCSATSSWLRTMFWYPERWRDTTWCQWWLPV